MRLDNFVSLHMAYTINPDRSKPWNGLPELPIDASYYQTIPVLEQLGNTKAALARLQGRSVIIPNQGLLINSISLQEAKASSEIENIFTTDDELYKAFSQDQVPESSGPAKEVLNYREALWEGYQYLHGDRPFDIGYFEKTYQIVTGYNDGIRPQVANIYIKEGGSGPNAGKAFYTPPRGLEIVPAKMTNLIDFLNNDTLYPIDPLLKMAIGHFQFEAIHPFRDGNGRTGRIFNIHYLTKKGLLDFPILYLSRYILEHKEAYYEGLAGITQRASWQQWLLYMLKAVEVTANLTYHKINELVDAKDSILDLLTTENFSKPEMLVNALFTQPFTRVKHLQPALAENTARKYLDQLVKMNVVEKRMISGGAYYLNLELHRILAE